MRGYILRRLLLFFPSLALLTFGAYALVNLAPGNPAETYLQQRLGHEPTAEQVAQQEQAWGLDAPLAVRYERWLGGMVTGDFGRSFFSDEAVLPEIARRAVRTLRLALPAAAIAVLGGLSLGVAGAASRDSPLDHSLRILSLMGASLPSFWVGLLLIELFSVEVHLLPAVGQGGLRSEVLPVVTLALGPMATLARVMRASLLEVLGQEYVRTARSKGLSQLAVLARHAVPNALAVVVTLAGSITGGLMLGAVIVEEVFAWPGIGQLTVSAIFDRDYPVLQGVIFLAGVVFLVVNLVVDLAYAMLDPTIRVGASTRG